MSDTPRTDCECATCNDDVKYALCEDWDECVDAKFARELERENNRLREALESAHDRLLRGDDDMVILDILKKGWKRT